MRTRSITYIIHRYGLSSKRLFPKNRVRYEDAIKTLTSLENDEICIKEIIDNVLTPHKSISDHCQVDGCNRPIRWEYVLHNKKTGNRLIAGSTCVWPLLGLNELEVKRLGKFEDSLLEYAELVEWARKNKDIVDMLHRAESENIVELSPYWEEIKYCKLMPEDEDYLRSLDLDKIIERLHARKDDKYRSEAQQVLGAEADKVALDKLVTSMKEREDRANKDYERVLESLKELAQADPTNEFFASLLEQSGRRHLTYRQVEAIKRTVNRNWFEKHIAGTDRDKSRTCNKTVLSVIGKGVKSGELPPVDYKITEAAVLCWYYPENREAVEKHFEAAKMSDYLLAYRVVNGLV